MVLFVSWVFLAIIVGSSQAACPLGWLTEAGHCFFLSHTELSWPDATEMCRDFGGSLFTFTNDARVKLLLTRLMGHHNRAITYKQIWVGGTDEVQEGKWLWILESGGLPQQLPVDTFQTEHVIHNSNSRNCLSMRAAGDSFTWYADECTDKNYYLCEIIIAENLLYFDGVIIRCTTQSDAVKSANYKQIWVGANDEIEEGKWTWTLNHESVPQQLVIDTFAQETVGHNTHIRNCLSLKFDDHSWVWYADGCTDSHYYLCDRLNGGYIGDIPTTFVPGIVVG